MKKRKKEKGVKEKVIKEKVIKEKKQAKQKAKSTVIIDTINTKLHME